MGFFRLHRTSSSSSARSASSAISSSSSWTTPRTSTDLADDYMTATLKPHFVALRSPLLDLPFEILQHIASYLDDASAAKFSLSSRQICYAIGTQRLAKYISSSPSRLDARDRLEETIERALPDSWHCAWCDKFHSWSAKTSPARRTEVSHSPCTEYNSYLTDSTGYTLRYHHLRLALAAHKFGPAHGIPLSAFTHTSSGTLRLFNTPVQTSTSHTAKIINSRFLLHTSFSALLPAWVAQHRHLISALFPLLPPILIHHRASAHGHTALMAACDNVIRRGWRVLGAQSCSDCATDWTVSSYAIPRSVVGEFVRVSIQTWRDLGNGRGPFEKEWRAHGAYIPGTEESCVREERARERGSVRSAFEGGLEDAWGGDAEANAEIGGSEWERLAYSWQVDKQRAEQRDQEMEWRAIWKYIERRAGVEAESC
ncbi:hypothetical protein SVAN01_08660 [Stagonosporopsis vannaccii]|nr:hypothetical protein SVAN01_08660 [Stagonosporopsis vannaccii]